MKTYPKWLSAAVLSAMLASPAAALETKAKNVILMDYDTGEYLFAENAFVPVAPASMSKLMTVYVLFSKLKDGTLSLAGRRFFRQRKRVADGRCGQRQLDHVSADRQQGDG